MFTTRNPIRLIPSVLFSILTIASCARLPEMSREEALLAREVNNGREAIISQCVVKRGEERSIGKPGGTWNIRLANDPMTFNTLVARDYESGQPIKWLNEGTVDYDPFTRTWMPGLVDYEIENDLEAGTQKITCTLREGLVWYIPSTGETRPITSEDPVYWYNEVEGDPALQNPGYAGQFIVMPDGSKERITMSAIDERTFEYRFPRISSDPILEISGGFWPAFIFKPVKEQAYREAYEQRLAKELKRGTPEEEAIEAAGTEAKSKAAAALNNLLSINTDPMTIPTCGPFYIESYQPGIKVNLRRNPHYYLKDAEGNDLPYIEKVVYHIIRDDESAVLEFLNGTTDSGGIPKNKLERMLAQQKEKDFSVYFGGPDLMAYFIAMNQNPAAMPPLIQSWFFQKEFRQAISCLINRQELISQVYLGLADPCYDFFSPVNSMYDPEIQLEYRYNPERAMELLASIGMEKDAEGQLRDKEGNAVEFGFTFGAESEQTADIATIIAHNLEVAGMKVRLQPTDFQKMVNQLINTYDWEMVTVGLGPNRWPSGSSNVWQSSGNFHLWHPNQESPVTDWEAEVDRLYSLGRFSPTPEEAKPHWDAYQRLILEQMPFIYLPYSYQFRAFRNRWANITFDVLPDWDEGVDIRYVYLKD